jgi:phage repressor protein C with HTH and peptisase S24 domain
MQPRFNSGDPLLLDRGFTTVIADGVYFFRLGDNGFIKQLQRIPVAGKIVLRAKSYNKDYDPFDITADMDFQVFGKVLMIWHSEQV